jgi:hypothetical protein
MIYSIWWIDREQCTTCFADLIALIHWQQGQPLGKEIDVAFGRLSTLIYVTFRMN